MIKEYLQKDGCVLLDVRTSQEFESGFIPGSVNIPVQELEERLGELPKKKPVAVFCAAGVRSTTAESILRAAGFEAENTISVGVMAHVLELQSLSVVEDHRAY